MKKLGLLLLVLLVLVGLYAEHTARTIEGRSRFVLTPGDPPTWRLRAAEGLSAEGFHDHPPRANPVVIVGAGATAALEVDIGRSWVGQAEATLQRQHPDLDLLNAGVPGIDLERMYSLAAAMPAMRMLVLGLETTAGLPTEVLLMGRPQRPVYVGVAPTVLPPWLFWLLPHSAALRAHAGQRAQALLQERPLPDALQLAEARLAAHLPRFIQLARNRQIPLAVLLLPPYPLVETDDAACNRWLQSDIGCGWHTAQLQQMEQACRAAGVPVLSALPTLQARIQAPSVQTTTYDPPAHAAIADALVALLSPLLGP